MAIVGKGQDSIFVDVRAVVQAYVDAGLIEHAQPTPSGNVNACCPAEDHEDSNPSWGIDLRTGKHNCFGCDFRGDAITLVRELERIRTGKTVSVRKAKEHLVKLTMDPNMSGSIARQKIRRRNMEFRYYPNSILEAMEERFDYLVDRGVSEKTCKIWDVRYNQERYCVPVRISNGQIVGFVGIADKKMREEGKDDPNFKKVLNSPGLWTRQVLLGQHQDIKRGTVVLVEGPVDCLKVHSATEGRMTVMALLRSTLSPEQAEILRQKGARKVISFSDNDDAGRSMDESIKKHCGSWATVVVPQYEEEDPGDMEPGSITRLIEV